MRVIVVSRGNLVHVGPFLDAMLKRGWEVHFAALSPWQFPRDDVPCHPCYLEHTRSKPLTYAYGARALRTLARRIRPDLVWAHYASSGGTVAWLSGFRPYCITAHGSDILDRSQQLPSRWLLRHATRSAQSVHAVSPQITQQLFQLGMEHDRVFDIPFGIRVCDIPFRPPEFRQPLRLACTRSLQYTVYDIPTILKAVAVLRDRCCDVQLTLCGEGQLREQLEEQTKKLGLSAHVSFLGGFSPDDLIQVLHGHDLYVSASLSDGASLSLMEAMAAGLVPIVSDIPANRDWLDDELSFFPPGDYCQLADRIQQAMGQGCLAKEIAERNRRIVEERCDRTANMIKILDQVEETVRRFAN